jgi:hypothetical protein
MVALISKGLRKNTLRGVLLMGVELSDAQEEVFVRMVCDGVALGVAFARAGFKLHRRDAPSLLFALPRIQARANAILEARRTTGVVTLAEVTDMLQRVFAGAHSEGEYNAAHNAAFSLARLYGHVTDKATLEVIRRPSRDPDAPSEQALASWVETLPLLPSPQGPVVDAVVVSGPEASGPEASGPEASGPEASGPGDPAPAVLAPAVLAPAVLAPAVLAPAVLAPSPGAPAAPLGLEAKFPNDINWLGAEPSGPEASGPSGLEPLEGKFPNDFKGLATGGRSENGAPVGPVTETLHQRGRSGLLGDGALSKKGSPAETKRVPVKKREKSGAEKRRARKLKAEMKDLFG